jgi:hypothetical protein
MSRALSTTPSVRLKRREILQVRRRGQHHRVGDAVVLERHRHFLGQMIDLGGGAPCRQRVTARVCCTWQCPASPRPFSSGMSRFIAVLPVHRVGAGSPARAQVASCSSLKAW